MPDQNVAEFWRRDGRDDWQGTKAELLVVLRERYLHASKSGKGRILDEFTAVSGCHRKHAVRLSTRARPSTADGAVVGRTIYDDAVRQALVVSWEAADRICGKRLKAVLPSPVAALEEHGHIALDVAYRQRVLSASPATIDRLLTSVRDASSNRKRRRTPSRSGRRISIRTFPDWKDPSPGCLEIDFVAHGGTSVQGSF